ncbi:MAG: serine O-acetyltransferase EpsC [Microbacteriaceae bacterium]
MALFARMREDIETAKRRDPAARSALEIWLIYPGLHAIWRHRWEHWLWTRGFRFPARVGAQWSRFWTGIEIHPGAVIGRRFFIDHGMGVVIGETAVIGDDVMLYHGVTLGGRSTASGKRHPTLGNGVMVGAGAVILGAVTVGDRSQVGANAVVLTDAPADSILVGIPAVARPRGQRSGLDAEEFPIDPAIYI